MNVLLGIIVVLELLALIFRGVANGLSLPEIVVLVCVTLGGIIYALFWFAQPIPDTEAFDGDPAPLAADEEAPLVPPGDPSQDEVEELDRRPETPGEIAARSHSGPGLMALGLYLLGGFLLFISGLRNGSAWWLLLGLPLFASACGLAWRREQQSPAAQEVLRISGPLRKVEGEYTEGGRVEYLCIGKYQLQAPDHWQPWLRARLNRRLRVELRSSDNSLVSAGDQLSIEAEEQSMPSVPLGEHGLFASISALLLFTTLYVGGNLDIVTLYAKALFRPAELLVYDSAQEFLADPPALGSKVTLSGKARCGVEATTSPHPPRIDCSQLRWGGEPLRVTDISPSDPALRLASGAPLKVRPVDPREQAALQASQMGGSPMLVEEVSALLLAIDAHCAQAGPDAQAACRHLQMTLRDSLVMPDGTAKPVDWPEWLALARSGRQTAGPDSDRALITRANLRHLRAALYGVAPAAMQAHYGQALQNALANERGSILIRNARTRFDRSSERCDAGFVRDAQEPYWKRIPLEDISESQLDWLGFWQEFRALDREACQPQMQYEGMLVRFGTDAHGKHMIELDDKVTIGVMLRALILLLTVLVFCVLTALHSHAHFRYKAQSRLRKARLGARIRQHAG
ncbi:IgaA/UmoB family intracellular growth attenuator [Uliginosibacterium sp. 31-16]|uniref:IgaA/UmoB family intracellular growth attenuator n=1 Tax=Uliginosibacterium sp. 31-16 TaxID=3068315 RepID=UPI00273D3C15|nr:IgaA/UmoB family intracellular growth attenuator [Uliginosibacterium sp. 31-16]MDP5240568.1 IgaA/UmoB family intracellular growth attenuator [Uliginosibacterium sp. 31-16]